MQESKGRQGKEQNKRDRDDSMALDRAAIRRMLTKGRVWGAEFDSYEVQ